MNDDTGELYPVSLVEMREVVAISKEIGNVLLSKLQ